MRDRDPTENVDGSLSPSFLITQAIAQIKKINDTTYEVPQAVLDGVLANPMAALEVYTKLRDAKSLKLTLTRRGKSITITYKIK